MAMRGTGRGTVLVPLPEEIDVGNADEVRERLRAAFAPGVTTVIADLSATTFCDSSGISGLLASQERGAAAGAELRLAVPEGQVRRVLEITGLGRVLQIYSSLDAALEGQAAASLAVAA